MNLSIDKKKNFREIIDLINSSKKDMVMTINNKLIKLYWNIGEYLSDKCKNEGWSNNIVVSLADFIKQTQPNSKGFSSQNLWRMKQFYELYCQNEKLSPLVREIGWTHHLIIVSKSKSMEEREFYLKMAFNENYSKRELECQISSSLFERTMLSKKKSLTRGERNLSENRKFNLKLRTRSQASGNELFNLLRI